MGLTLGPMDLEQKSQLNIKHLRFIDIDFDRLSDLEDLCKFLTALVAVSENYSFQFLDTNGLLGMSARMGLGLTHDFYPTFLRVFLLARIP